jgi:OmpA-OmpF porin, OOP family
MSVIKKIISLLIFFLILNFFTIYGFDYNNFSSNNENNVSLEKNIKLEEKNIIDEIAEFKNKNFDSFSEKEEAKVFSLVLTKKNDIIEMSGVFANAEDAKKISDFLNVNSEGEYKYEKNRVIDEYLLDEVAILATPLKDFLIDNSKLSVIDNDIVLSGELKDANYKDLLESILSRVKIDFRTDITVPEVVTSEDIKNIINSKTPYVSGEENFKSNISTNQDSKDSTISSKKEANLFSKLDEIQLSINNLLSTKKINFERRSSNITADSKIVLEAISKILNDNPSFKIEVAGHTDSRGKESLNKKISQDRASSVRDVLISLGIDKDRIKAVGYGEEFPIAKDDENGLSEINRRVEFNILGE